MNPMNVLTARNVILAAAVLSLPACHKHDEHAHHDEHRIVATKPLEKDITLTQQYVGMINAQKYIAVQAMAGGRLEAILVNEGEKVDQGQPMFKILPVLYQSRMDAEKARVEAAQQKYNGTLKLFNEKVVSERDLKIHEAELREAEANLAKAEAEVGFTDVKAAFPGIVDQQEKQLGSIINEKEILTYLSDNRVMWVKFNVPEKRYFEYMALWGDNKRGSQIEMTGAKIELKLADGNIFKHSGGNLVTVEGVFNRNTGTITFRADIPNPEGLLRHGQTGTILVRRKLEKAIVIPQRATFEILDKRYVWVIGHDHVVHQREIEVAHEMDDIYIIKSGIGPNDEIVLEGVRDVHEGSKLHDIEFISPAEAVSNQKKPAE